MKLAYPNGSKDVLEIRGGVHEYIKERSYKLWEKAGRPNCDGKEFWYAAIKEFHQIHDSMLIGEEETSTYSFTKGTPNE